MGDSAADQDNQTSSPSQHQTDAQPSAGSAPDFDPTCPASDGVSADSEQAASGIIPPVPDSIEQTTVSPGQFGPEGGPFAPPGQGGFPPPGFAPPDGGPYPPDPGFAPPGGFPMGDHSGPFAPPADPSGFAPPWAGGPGGFPGEQGGFAPPGDPNGFPPQHGGFAPGQPGDPNGVPPPGDHGGFAPGQGGFPEGVPPPAGFPGEQHGFAPGPPADQGFPQGPGDPNGFAPGPPADQGFPQGDLNGFAPPGPDGPAPGYGEVRQETPYGDARQEIGSDGMVRRVFDQQQGPPPGFDQPTGDGAAAGAPATGGWAPPAPQPQQQPEPQPQQTGWPGGPGGPGPQQGYQQPPFQPQQLGQPGQPGQPGQSVGDLNLLRRARRSPRSGWRRAVHKMSGGAINPGESSADVVHRELVDRVNQPVRGDYRIAILSLKGGVGKTTTTVGLGSTFASMRGDRVIAIDANPDLGTLAHRVPRQTRSTVRNLLEDQHISRYSDVRAHTSQAPSRLEVLASEQDPAVSEAFSEDDYRRAIGILQQFYNIILTDCGTGLMHSAMAGVLDMASSLILVTSPAIDGARSASATLDWLEHHGYSKLVERTVVVVNASRRGASTVDLDQLRKLFLDRTRAVQVVPFDDHLAEGAEIDLELVSKPTRTALLELAAMVADDFGYHVPQPPFPGPQTQYPGQPPQYPGAPGHYPGQQGY